MRLLMDQGDPVLQAFQWRPEFNRDTIQLELPLARLIDPCQNFRSGGFASTVLTHKGMNLSGSQVDTDIRQNLVPEKGFSEVNPS